jgi:hypothetical protein
MLKNGINFELSSTIRQQCRRWHRELIAPPFVQLKKRHVKNIMHLHAGWKLEFISRGTNFLDNLKRSKVTVHELLDTIKLETEMFGAEEDKVTNGIGDMPTLEVGIMSHVMLSILEASFGPEKSVLNELSMRR